MSGNSLAYEDYLWPKKDLFHFLKRRFCEDSASDFPRKIWPLKYFHPSTTGFTFFRCLISSLSSGCGSPRRCRSESRTSEWCWSVQPSISSEAWRTANPRSRTRPPESLQDQSTSRLMFSKLRFEGWVLMITCFPKCSWACHEPELFPNKN